MTAIVWLPPGLFMTWIGVVTSLVPCRIFCIARATWSLLPPASDDVMNSATRDGRQAPWPHAGPASSAAARAASADRPMIFTIFNFGLLVFYPLGRRENSSRASLRHAVRSRSALNSSAHPCARVNHAHPLSLTSEFEQFRRIVAHDHLALAPGEPGNLLDKIHWPPERHALRKIGAHHDAVHAHEVDEIAHDLGMVSQRVVIEAAQVRARRLLHVLQRRAPADRVVEPPDQPGEGSAGVRQVDFQFWKRVQHAAVYQAG